MARPLNISAGTLTAMYTNARALFNVTYREQTNLYPQFCTIIKSKSLTEQYNFAVGLGSMKEWVDERKLGKWATESFEKTNEKFEDSISVTRDEIEDDRLGLFGPMIQEMAIGARQFYDERVAALINQHIGDVETTFPAGFDGVPLFAIDHAWTTGYKTSQDNIRGVSVANAGKLDLTYGQANIQAAQLQMAQFKRPDGKPFGTKADTLMVASNLVPVAKQILWSPTMNLAGTAGSATERGNLNPLADSGLRILENPWLTDSYWVLMCTKRAVRPVIFQDRRPTEFDSLTKGDSETAFMREEYYYGVSNRFAVAPWAWWMCVGGDGT